MAEPPPPSPTTVTPPSPTQTFLHKTLIQFLNRLETLQHFLPFLILYTLWSLSFIIISSVLLILTFREKRLEFLQIMLFVAWTFSTALQRLFHVRKLVVKYRIRNFRNRNVVVDQESLVTSSILIPDRFRFRFVRILEGIITDFSWSFLYLGFVLMVMGRETLLDESPRLYWLLLVFYPPDLLLAVFRYLTKFFDNNTSTQNDESHADAIILPTYGFEVSTDDGRVFRMVPMGTNDPDFSSVRVLQAEDSCCCICFSNYEDGEKLNSLRCNHHFHAACLLKWLRVKAICPLCNCKFIIKRVYR